MVSTQAPPMLTPSSSLPLDLSKKKADVKEEVVLDSYNDDDGEEVGTSVYTKLHRRGCPRY